MTRRVFLTVICLTILFAFGAAAHAQSSGGLVASTYQRFERGLMVWESETGTIYIILDKGVFTRVRSRDYGALQSNSIAAPLGLIAPVMGFGQVWGSQPELRQAIGGAVAGEGSYLPMIDTAFGVTLLDTPDGRRLMGLTNRWIALPFESQLNVPVPTPTATSSVSPVISTQAAFQLYENGFMIWRADTGEVWVFAGNNGGSLQMYPVYLFQDLPNNPVQTPPSSFVNPINGFGRVWYNYPFVRSTLGWARTTETSYITFIEINGQFGTITGPDRTPITFGSGTWTW